MYILMNETTGEIREAHNLALLWKIALRERKWAMKENRPMDDFKLGVCTYVPHGWPEIKGTPLAVFCGGTSGKVWMMNAGVKKVFII